MSHFREIIDSAAPNSVSKWNSQSKIQQSDHQNKNQSTFSKTILKKQINRLNSIIAPASKNITRSRSSSSGIITVEYREDEYKSEDLRINASNNTSATMCQTAPPTSRRLVVKKSTSKIKSKKERNAKKDKQLIKTVSRVSTCTLIAEKIKLIASADANIVRDKAFQLRVLESKKNKNCSKVMKQRRVQHPIVSVSKHSRKHKKHHSKSFLEYKEPTSRKNVIQNLSTQSLSNQYKSAEDLHTPSVSNQDNSTQDLNIQNIDRNPTAQISLKKIFRFVVVNFVNGVIQNVCISFVLFIWDFIIRKFIK